MSRNILPPLGLGNIDVPVPWIRTGCKVACATHTLTFGLLPEIRTEILGHSWMVLGQQGRLDLQVRRICVVLVYCHYAD
jgi:hypothetical protein